MEELVFKEVREDNKEVARELIAEYGHYLFDDLKLMAGSASFFKELEHFPGEKYILPEGIFYMVYEGDAPIGCMGLRKFDGQSCELKRMYIREQYRGRGYARQLISFILVKAKQMGYSRMLLDTNIEMPAALRAYLNAGFKEIPPYCENENANPVFLEYDLAQNTDHL